jgi:hypothetical protein
MPIPRSRPWAPGTHPHRPGALKPDLADRSLQLCPGRTPLKLPENTAQPTWLVNAFRGRSIGESLPPAQ